jgi:hypothetical protein
MVGILPHPARPRTCSVGAITDAPRYRALDWSLSRVRAEPFRDRHRPRRDPRPLRVLRDNIVPWRGPNTSCQVTPARRPRGLRAQLLTPAPLATGPSAGRGRQSRRLFLGPGAVGGEPVLRLCSRQTARRPRHPWPGSAWCRGSAFRDRLDCGGSRASSCSQESVRHHEPLRPILGRRGPALAGWWPTAACPGWMSCACTRGTVWRWNRAIYDTGYGGPPAHRAACPAGRADGGRHACQRRLPAGADPGPGPRGR